MPAQSGGGEHEVVSGDAVQEVSVYTDGSCMGNPGPGGWAWAAEVGLYTSGAEASTTNQRMEVTAALEAVQWLVDGGIAEIGHGVPGGSHGGAVTVVSDSNYLVNCFRQRWWEGWMRRGWKNSRGDRVANRDLWEPLLHLVLDGPLAVHFVWVRGHSGHPMNELVNDLAQEAARSQRGSSTRGQ